MVIKRPILQLDGVVKKFGANVVVHPFSLEVAKGEFIALMGPSGCGKTTTLRMVAGLEEPSAGDIRMWDRPITDDMPWARDTPLVWQNYALFPFLNVVENVEFGLKQRGLPKTERRKKSMEWLERMGIAEHATRDIARMSGGQRQRVALARALVTEPELLLLDEPLSALDAHLRVKMQSELTRLHRELGITFLYVTHNQSEAFAMAGRVVIMKDGHVQQIGTPNEVYRAPANHFVAEFVGTNNILGGTVRELGEGQIVVETGFGRFRAPCVTASGRLWAARASWWWRPTGSRSGMRAAARRMSSPASSSPRNSSAPSSRCSWSCRTGANSACRSSSTRSRHWA